MNQLGQMYLAVNCGKGAPGIGSKHGILVLFRKEARWTDETAGHLASAVLVISIQGVQPSNLHD